MDENQAGKWERMRIKLGRGKDENQAGKGEKMRIKVGRKKG